MLKTLNFRLKTPQSLDRSDRSIYFQMMKTIASYEAKSRFSEILRQAAGGETFIITRNGQRMAELRPISQPKRKRVRGMLKQAFGPVGPDFNAPLDAFADYR